MSMDVNEITYQINGTVFEINRLLGPGFLEKVYENALLIEMRGRGLKREWC
jgi:GxxExxY protein